ncbi:hypothetical protein BV22DRAFT_1135428 [Leucogyrophana mollusca]|uniref:Uncharacterized protein n=1 Tax=Leucogyrophana mollusca TaxID=85980 RepID=A0ACB8AVL7_9AGAM|nr:hypothetical protein BV22DRAFT_1135428 [Leucogyrophana mollusca]
MEAQSSAQPKVLALGLEFEELDLSSPPVAVPLAVCSSRHPNTLFNTVMPKSKKIKLTYGGSRPAGHDRKLRSRPRLRVQSASDSDSESATASHLQSSLCASVESNSDASDTDMDIDHRGEVPGSHGAPTAVDPPLPMSMAIFPVLTLCPPTLSRSRHCYMCSNGGKVLTECDVCINVVCEDCHEVPVPSFRPDDVPPDVVFLCPSCHEVAFKDGRKRVYEPYFAYYYAVAASDSNVIIQRRFFDQPVTLRGHFTLTSRSKLVANTLAVLHLYCVDQNPAMTPVASTVAYLGPWLSDDLIFFEISFDLSSHQGRSTYEKECQHFRQLVSTRQSFRLVLFITTHSNDAGDLSVEANGAYTATDFFQAVIINSGLTDVAVNATVFLLACGAIVTVDNSLSRLRDVVDSLSLEHLIAFSAKAFSPNLVAQFVNSYAQHVLIEGFPLLSAMKDLLSEGAVLSRHTDIFVFTRARDRGGVTEVLKFVWTHRQTRPWGKPVPTQCDICKVSRPWGKVQAVQSKLVLRCKGHGGTCAGKIEVACPHPQVKWICRVSNGGRWMAVPMQVPDIVDSDEDGD